MKGQGFTKRIKEILGEQQASSFPLAVGIVLALLILLCGVSEYFHLQIIASGVCNAVEDAIISTVNDNYAGVYHGAREGYSGNYIPYGTEGWEEALDTGDIYAYLDETLGTVPDSGRHVKYADDSKTELEYAIDSLSVTIRNAPLAPSDPSGSQKFEADAVVWLVVPVRFGGRVLTDMTITLKVQAGYTEVF